MRVLVLADDLIWSTRLIAQVQAAGADAAPVRTLAALNQALPAADAVIVDLTARAYDGVVAVRKAADAGRRVLAVGQHDDAELRRRGARRRCGARSIPTGSCSRTARRRSRRGSAPLRTARRLADDRRHATDDPAGPLPRTTRARGPGNVGRGLRRAPRRRGPGPPLPDGLRGAAAGAAHDARHRPGRRPDPARRPAARGAGARAPAAGPTSRS